MFSHRQSITGAQSHRTIPRWYPAEFAIGRLPKPRVKGGHTQHVQSHLLKTASRNVLFNGAGQRVIGLMILCFVAYLDIFPFDNPRIRFGFHQPWHFVSCVAMRWSTNCPEMYSTSMQAIIRSAWYRHIKRYGCWLSLIVSHGRWRTSTFLIKYFARLWEFVLKSTNINYTSSLSRL